MVERLVRIEDADELKRLQAAGHKIVHRVGGLASVGDPSGVLRGQALAVPEVEELPAEAVADDIGRIALALRQTDEWRERKQQRVDTGVDIDDLISGEVSS